MVTASHNPTDYNGLKFVREQAKPVSGDTGLQDIRRLAEAGEFVDARRRARSPSSTSSRPGATTCCRTWTRAKLKPLSIVCNGGNGGAAIGIDLVEKPPAVPVHQGPPRAGRRLPERRAEPDDRGEPRGDGAQRPPRARGHGHRLRRRLRPLLLLRRGRAVHRRLLHRGPAGLDVPRAASAARRSCTIPASSGTRSRSSARPAAGRCSASRATPS